MRQRKCLQHHGEILFQGGMRRAGRTEGEGSATTPVTLQVGRPSYFANHKNMPARELESRRGVGQTRFRSGRPPVAGSGRQPAEKKTKRKNQRGGKTNGE